jgi:hypothetical protein
MKNSAFYVKNGVELQSFAAGVYPKSQIFGTGANVADMHLLWSSYM